MTGSPLKRLFADTSVPSSGITGTPQFDANIKDYLYKIKNFDSSYPEDLYLDEKDHDVFLSSLNRFRRIQQHVGYGHFCLLNFDDALIIARDHVHIGAFTNMELAFLERIFNGDGAAYGFFGKKPFSNITDHIRKDHVINIPKSGNFLYQGPPLETFEKLKKDIGDDLVLTSGIRSITKQFLLFLEKVARSDGNLSRASRSLAPPGYSYHGIGDFDVGQSNYGAANFTEQFTESSVYNKLEGLGYICLRYPTENRLGVRFEPWHIRVTDS